MSVELQRVSASGERDHFLGDRLKSGKLKNIKGATTSLQASVLLKQNITKSLPSSAQTLASQVRN